MDKRGKCGRKGGAVNRSPSFTASPSISIQPCLLFHRGTDRRLAPCAPLEFSAHHFPFLPPSFLPRGTLLSLPSLLVLTLGTLSSCSPVSSCFTPAPTLLTSGTLLSLPVLPIFPSPLCLSPLWFSLLSPPCHPFPSFSSYSSSSSPLSL